MMETTGVISVASQVNPGLARYEQVKRISILPRELSVDSEELTATMKLRRKVIGEKHSTAITDLFD